MAPLDPTLYAIPGYLLAIGVELAVLRRRPDLAGYEPRDALASLAIGIGSILPVALLNAGVFALATALWPWRLVDLGAGPLGWAVAMVGWDFAYYWQHRAEHEIRVLWACHVTHHSSRRYHLVTALRQPWTPWTHLVFYPPLALLGVRPELILLSGGLNLIYQFWVHTEVVGRLPAALEAVLNTPSHHRVHHGSNARYLDRNYGGILIVWDRLFGTFEAESEPVAYGITRNVDTHHPVALAFHEYAAIARDVAGARTWGERAGYLLRRPGWRPTGT